MTAEVATPYKGEEAALPDLANFNTQLARGRIWVEQVIKQVKKQILVHKGIEGANQRFI